MKPKLETPSSFRNSSDNTMLVMKTINHDLATRKSRKLVLECEKMSLPIENSLLDTKAICMID